MNLEFQYQRETGKRPDKDYLLIDLSDDNLEDQEEREKELEKLYDYIKWLEEKLETKLK
jgi:hypothetical protein